MRHIRTVTAQRPASAQVDVLLEVLQIIQALLTLPATLLSQGQQLVTLASNSASLLAQLSAIFGFDIPQKTDGV